MKFKYFIALIVFSTIVSCKKRYVNYYQEENGVKYNELVSFVEIGKTTFSLGDKDGFWHYSWGLNYASDGALYFSFLNINERSIVFYNVNNGVKRKVLLKSEGANGLGFLPPNSSHLLNNKNDFFVYNQATGVLFNVDSLGTIKNKYDIVDYKMNKDVSFPEPSGTSPFKIKDDNVFFPCAKNRERTDYSDCEMVLKYNLNTRSYEYLAPLPEIYNKAFWGASFKYNTSFTFNETSSQVILSYPITHFLYKFDLKKGVKIDSMFVGSKYFKEFKPFSMNIYDGLKKNRNFKRENIFALSNSDYSKIMYDEFRKLYYRVAFIRPSMEEVSRGSRVPDFSIIVLDSNFVKIGEKRFSGKKYDVSTIASSRRGIWLARKDMYTIDEDNLTFDIFDLKNEK